MAKYANQHLAQIRFQLLLLLLIVSPGLELAAQTEDENQPKKKNPYELISSYYNNWSSPFTKGNGYIGLAFSLQDEQLENVPRLLDRVLMGNQMDYDITFKGGYFIGNYSMIGVNVNYSQESFEGQILDQNSDSLSRESIRVRSIVTPNLKIYFPVVPNERLSFFTEIGFGFGGATTLRNDIRNVDEVTRTFVDEFIFNAGLSAGLTFFAIENFALEVELNNLIGYTYRNVNTSINYQPESNTKSNDVNFRINLLSLRLGLAYYFRGKNAAK